MSSLHGPWPFAIAGTMLILSSTFIIGVMAFKAEQTLLRTQKELETTRSQLQETQQYYDMAQLQVNLAVLQRLVVRSNAGQNVGLETKSQRGFAETLLSALLRLHIAAGKNVISQQQAEDLKSLSAKAIEGDNDALEKLKSLILETMLISDKYREDLRGKKAKLEKDQDELNQKIVSWRNWAIILQIVGLVLLLTKEFPDYLWNKKKKA
ncbi:MAG TPA: hypothetical protein DDY17_11235 [Syntrophaceae bacterium]|jgi:hypothetical protein|nr:hypothetical protein [Syntrophaceae bacterium]